MTRSAGVAVRNKESIGAIALAGLAALALAACGGPASSSTPSPSPRPTPTPSPTLVTAVQACSLVTAADASSATGATLTANAAFGSSVPGACFYASADAKTTVLVFAQVYPDATAAQSITAQQLAAALPGAAGLGTAKVVTGIGDKAVEYTTSGASAGIMILVFKANVVLLIMIVPSSSSIAVEQLATTAVGRI